MSGRGLPDHEERVFQMKCTKCGSELIPGNRFCVKCGARAPEIVPEEIRETVPPKRPVWVLVVLLALVAAGGAPLFFTQRPHSGGSSPAPISAASTAAPESAAEPTAASEPAAEPTAASEPAPAASLGHIREVTATSVYSGEYSYLPALIRDGDLTTAWVEGVSGQGEGESITIRFDVPCSLSGFSIHAGYHKTESLYQKNSRPKEIELTFSDGSSCRVTLEDRMAPQTVTLSAPVETDSLTIRLVSVYPGTAYTDTAISEIVPF